jgi:hypothetical protein
MVKTRNKQKWFIEFDKSLKKWAVKKGNFTHILLSNIYDAKKKRDKLILLDND